MLGIVFALISAVCYGLMSAIQKYCLSSLKKFSLKKLVKNKFWLFSILVGFIGMLFYLLALRFAQLTIVQPLLSISLIIPVLIGYFSFKEKNVSWISIILILIGVILVSL